MIADFFFGGFGDVESEVVPFRGEDKVTGMSVIKPEGERKVDDARKEIKYTKTEYIPTGYKKY